MYIPSSGGMGGAGASDSSFVRASDGCGAATMTLPDFFPARALFLDVEDDLPSEGTSYFGPMYTQIRSGKSAGLEGRIHSKASIFV